MLHIEPTAEEEMRARAEQYTMFTWVQIPHLDVRISYSVRRRAGARGQDTPGGGRRSP